MKIKKLVRKGSHGKGLGSLLGESVKSVINSEESETPVAPAKKVHDRRRSAMTRTIRN
jgi:hypothetical protein